MNPSSTNRLARFFAFILAAFILTGVLLAHSAAQTSGRRSAGARVVPGQRGELPLNAYKLHELPLQRMSEADYKNWTQRLEGVRASGLAPAAIQPAAVAPPPTQPQFIDLTTTPRPPQVGESTRSQEIHPFWSWDQQYIFFASNNVDPVNSYGTTAPPGNAKYHIYRMTSDGAFVVQITGGGTEANSQQEFPALNHAQTKLAYVQKDTVADPGHLYVLNLSTGQRVKMTGVFVANNPLNSDLVSIRHPFWSPNDNAIVFAARRQSVTNDVYNIYLIDATSKVVRRVTNGTPGGVESIDPTFHPDSGDITFAANATGVNGTTGDLNYVATPLRDFDGNGTATDVDHNLFRVAQAGPSASRPIVQLTTATSDDIEPVYNQSDYPPNGAGPFNNYLAFSSRGRQGGTTYDIYFNNGSTEASDTPIRLFTPDTNAGSVPLNQTDERYPAWSAGLPPQNPIDRIAFSSNRRNNTADLSQPLVAPAGDTDIWAAEVTDITPPTLFTYDEQKGEVLHIANAPAPRDPTTEVDGGRRVGIPGETFYFYAKLKDLQYGIESVWLQIKDPDDHFTDSDDVNGDHKLYGENNTFDVRETSEPRVTHRLRYSYETDYEGIGVSDYRYYRGAPSTDIVTTGRYASYRAGIDDAQRWSGANFQPPTDAAGNPRWLRMSDDGRFPDYVAGDGVYSASWVTPNEPSDYYVDLIAYDKAINPQATSQRSNWIIYDNIWGFSTEAFSSVNPVLYVDDNGAGQKWPRGLKGSFRPFRSFRYGTESEIIDRPARYKPQQSNLISTNPVVYSAYGPVGGTPYDFLQREADYLQFSYNRNPTFTSFQRAYKYDIWRILAKGSVPEQIYNDYLPTTDEQPINITGSQTVQRPVPRRAILWNSPYTGDIFMGAGSILDQATQAQLTTYRSRGGRLVVAGGDILWALTVNGTVPQQFVQNVLGVDFAGDGAIGPTTAFTGTNIGLDITTDVFRLASFGTNNFPLGISTYFPFRPPANRFPLRADYLPDIDGQPFQVQDGSTPRAGWEQVYDRAMHANADAATRSKTVFMSFSLASMGRGYEPSNADARDTSPLSTALMNWRGKISHAMFCWMFSAELVGQVRKQEGGAPIAGAWVQAYQGGQLVGAAFTRADGTYAIRGLPVGGWSIRVDNPGFLGFHKADGTSAHGLEQAQLDVFLTQAAPGSISGSVLDKFQQPVAGARVKATLQASPLYTGQRDFFAITGDDGTYIIPSAPVGQYDVVVETLPPLFANPTPKFASPVTVNPAQETPGIDFEVEGQPGPLTVSVREQNADGTQGAPVVGAEVTLLTNSNPPSPITGFTGVTDSNGIVQFQSVPAGPILVSAFKFGRQEATVRVNIPQQSQVTLLLAPVVERDLYGLAVRALDDQPLVSGDLNPPVTLQLLRKLSQLPTPRTANVFAPPADTPGSTKKHNYRFTIADGNAAQSGEFTVALRNHPRFLDAQVDVSVSGTGAIVAPDLRLTGRPGVLTGRVVQNNGTAVGSPVAGAAITVISQRLQPGTVIGGGTSLADGTFRATKPDGSPIESDVVDVRIDARGFVSKTVTGIFLAGDTNIGDVRVDREARARVYGLVRRTMDNASPNPGVTVEFWTLPTSPFGEQKVAETNTFNPPTAGSDSYNYEIGATTVDSENLPAGTYEMRVVDRNGPNGSRYAAFKRTITVAPGETKRVDVDLTPLPGRVTGFVKENNATKDPIAGATVTLRRNGSLVATLTTDSQGRYTTSGPVAAGPYTLTATRFGFDDKTVNVFVENDITVADILLDRVPQSIISGLIRSKEDTSLLIAGAKVEVLDPADATETPLASTTSVEAAFGSPLRNYQLSVPPGTYIVRASKPGWKTAQTTVRVEPRVNLHNVHFTLAPRHVFGEGLLLISVPDDFPGDDIATVLGQDPATFKSAYWVTEARRYAIYPEPEAAQLRLGKAMFVRFTRRTPLTSAGRPAPAGPYSIPVKTGWNMIGSVRNTRIEWLRVRVATGDGQTRTMQQAMDAGIIQNGLWGFAGGRYYREDYMEPYAGYFVRALQDCTLIVPENNSVSSVTPADRRKVARMTAPTAAQVGAELGALGLGPAPRPAAPQRPDRTSVGSLLRGLLTLSGSPASFLFNNPLLSGTRHYGKS